MLSRGLRRAPGDVYWSNVSVLLHGQGANNATTIVDSSKNTKSLTANGDAKISTAQAKFGASSLAFDGSGDYLRATDSADFAFGSGNFCVEYWARFTSFSAFPITVDTRVSGLSVNGYSEYYDTGGKLNLFLNNSTVYTSAASISTGSWAHVAVSRSGTTLRVFINGALDGSVTDSTNMTDQKLLVGANVGVTPGTLQGNYMNGYMQDVRITKGVARYTAAFTPPSRTFPDH